MQKNAHPRGLTPVLFLVPLGLAVLDLALKALVLTHNAPEPTAAFVQATRFLNPGVAFSLPVPPMIVLPLSAVATLLFLWCAARDTRCNPTRALGWWAAGLGAAANLADRMVTGATTDYLLIAGRSAINIADGLIVGGIILALWYTPSPRERS